MDELVVDGGGALSGTIRVSGNKNAAFPLIAAALLSDEAVTLENLPDIEDVRIMLALVEGLGVTVHRPDPHVAVLQAGGLRGTCPDPSLVSRVRGALVLIGPLLARRGQVQFGRPGGDRIGRRRVDTHLEALSVLGADVRVADRFELASSGLHGADVLLDEVSVTATENVILAAVLAKGRTTVRNAASEPHVQELCHLLVRMGACIEGIGSNVLAITGVSSLGGATATLGGDYIEAGTFMVLAGCTGGTLRVQGVSADGMGMALPVLRRLGVRVEAEPDTLVVSSPQPLTVHPDVDGGIPKIEDGPWPAFPADLMSLVIVLATQASGTVLFHEKLYEGRLFFVNHLLGLGVRAVLCDPHRVVVTGPSRLRPLPTGLECPDIRAGMAMLAAALSAEGRTVIRSIEQIDRGYERIEAKLSSLGARVTRVTPPAHPH